MAAVEGAGCHYSLQKQQVHHGTISWVKLCACLALVQLTGSQSPSMQMDEASCLRYVIQVVMQ